MQNTLDDDSILAPPEHNEYNAIIPNLENKEGQFFIRGTRDGQSVEFAGYCPLTTPKNSNNKRPKSCSADCGEYPADTESSDDEDQPFTYDGKSYFQNNPAELCQVFRNIGDIVVAVDGIPVTGKPFHAIVALIQESNRSKCMFLRMRDIRCAPPSPKQPGADAQEENNQDLNKHDEKEKEELKDMIQRFESTLEQDQEHVDEVQQILELQQQALDNMEEGKPYMADAGAE